MTLGGRGECSVRHGRFQLPPCEVVALPCGRRPAGGGSTCGYPRCLGGPSYGQLVTLAVCASRKDSCSPPGRALSGYISGATQPEQAELCLASRAASGGLRTGW